MGVEIMSSAALLYCTTTAISFILEDTHGLAGYKYDPNACVYTPIPYVPDPIYMPRAVRPSDIPKSIPFALLSQS